jgi:hypothetical protein
LSGSRRQFNDDLQPQCPGRRPSLRRTDFPFQLAMLEYVSVSPQKTKVQKFATRSVHIATPPTQFTVGDFMTLSLNYTKECPWLKRQQNCECLSTRLSNPFRNVHDVKTMGAVEIPSILLVILYRALGWSDQRSHYGTHRTQPIGTPMSFAGIQLSPFSYESSDI